MENYKPIPTRTRRIVYRRRLNDGLGKKFRISVTVNVTDWFIDGKWDESMSCEEWAKVEAAIEKKYPGYFHQCYLNNVGIRKVAKDKCPACIRKKLKKQLTHTI